MKRESMPVRYRLVLTLAALAAIAVVSGAGAQEKFRLKPGARGKLCLNCHTTFQQILKNPFVHTPVKTGNCAGCHNPHASSHGKLLADESRRVCFKCHTKIIPDKARSVHAAAGDGTCTKCHDPHASKNRFSLVKGGNELCFTCHKGMGEAVKKAAFKHAPVVKDCLTCHAPHASAAAPALLKNDVAALCAQCHKTGSPAFTKQHANYPVAKTRCTSCHDPHGSDKAGMLYHTAHRPVANKMCNQCHEEPGAKNPFAVKRAGYELCRGCHSTMVNQAFNSRNLHGPVVGKRGCLNCHAPHASAESGLLRAPMLEVCGSCHAATVARQDSSPTKHPPVREGNCTACHAPHASDNPLLMLKPSTLDVCGACHDWKKHTMHPLGAQYPDKRNKNLSVDCLSCHRSHGAEQKRLLYYANINELCTQCHVQLTR